jgi:hypothetical protein
MVLPVDRSYEADRLLVNLYSYRHHIETEMLDMVSLWDIALQ